MREYEQYEGVYCALCRQLGKRYGLFARFALSYDLTFLALLRMALDDGECPSFSKHRCTCNPLKKCTFCGDSRHIDEAADITAVLIYHKLRDNLDDESFFRSIPARLALLPASRVRRRAAARMPGFDEKVSQSMRRQAEVEAAGGGTDAAAEPTALLLSELASMSSRDENEKRVLSRFGYCLGRWIYLTDAADDMEKDAKRNRFNPYLKAGSNPDFEKMRMEAGLSLNASLAECTASYNLLNIRRFDGILRNILELGLPNIQKLAVSGRLENRNVAH